MVNRRRYLRLSLLAVVIGFSALAIWWGITRRGFGPLRTVVIVANPMVVVSLNKEEGRLVLVKIPASTVITAVRGYGRYSLESLWRLGEIEKQEGVILRESLAEVLGIMLPWYIAPSQGSFASQPPTEIVKQVFSWSALIRHRLGAYRTNLPWGELVAWVKLMGTISTDRLTVLDLEKSRVEVSLSLPDGSVATTIDLERLDDMVGHLFEIESIRRERVTVSVFNTTDTPTLGQRAARRLSRLGILVTAVGNDKPTVDRCQLSGQEKALATKTAAAITVIFNCELERQTTGEERTDLVVRLGKTYQDSL